MAPLILSIVFSEANTTNAVKYLCDAFGLPVSQENAKIALKTLAVERIQAQKTQEKFEQAEGEPKIT